MLKTHRGNTVGFFWWAHTCGCKSLCELFTVSLSVAQLSEGDRAWGDWGNWGKGNWGQIPIKDLIGPLCGDN